MLRVIIVAMAAAVASAGVIHDGGCPDIKPIDNFNVSAYGGLWYEIAKFPNEAEKSGKCGKAEYTLGSDGVVKVKNSHVVEGVLSTIEGTAKLAADANGSAKLLVSLNFGPATSEMPLQVVATDYTTYAIAYNCKFDDKKNSHRDSIWILSRTNKLEGDAKTAVDNFFKNSGKSLDQTKLVYSDFSEEACKYSGTSVVSERPNEDLKKAN